MFKGHPLKSYLVYSVAAAIAYCIIAFMFLNYGSFRYTWILFIGNMLFACCIVTFILLYNNKRNGNAKVGTMVFAGHITTVMGIIIACIICVILYYLVPSFHTIANAPTSDVLKNPAPQLRSGKTNEFLLTLILNAVVGNISAGSFISIILPYGAKRNQKDFTAVKPGNEPNIFTQEPGRLKKNNK